MRKSQGIVMRILFLIPLLLTKFTFAQDTSVVYSTLDIVDNGNYESFEILSPVLDDYNVFFTGENHLFRNSNYKLQLKMLKYLHQKRGVRHLLLEFGYSRGYLVDYYVQTGDTSIYNVLNDYSYEEYAKLYKGIREYNATLDSADRIHIHGIDLERSFLTSVKLLNLKMPDRSVPVPDSIETDVEALRSLMGYNDKLYDKEELSTAESKKTDFLRYRMDNYSEYYTIKEIVLNFRRYETDYQAYLVDYYPIWKKVMSGIQAEMKRQEFENKRMFQAKIYRESYMYDQFVELIDSLDGERFFSQFGRCHTATVEQDEWCNFYHFRTLASRISTSEHPALKNKVCSIGTYYPKNEITWLSPEENKQVNNLIDHLKLKIGGLTLIRVSKDTTYFGSLHDKFQYIIINNNSLTEDFAEDQADKDEDTYNFYDPFFVNVDMTYSMFYPNLSAFNAFLNDKGLDPVGNSLVALGGDMTFFSNYYTYVRLSYNQFNRIHRGLSDSSYLDFDGWVSMFQLGSELTNNKIFNLAAYSGMGLSLFRMDVTSVSSNPANDNFFKVSNNQVDNFRNWGFLLDLGLDARINYKIFTVGLNGGYMFDVSNKRWTLDGKHLQESPKTSFSGLHLSATAGLNFKF